MTRSVIELMQSLEKCFENSGIKSGDSVACLVSGGIDSMVLLDLACRFRQQVPYRLSMVHFNFHLRRAESNEDEAFVCQEAIRRDLPIIRVQILMDKGSGIQNRARYARRSYMGHLARIQDFSHFLLGHQLDDQAETIVMRLIRGAGLKGLGGMSPTESLTTDPAGVSITRPLLSFPRRLIEQWAREHEIPFREDSSNLKDDYLRNRIRHTVIKEMKHDFPDILEVIDRASHLIRVERCLAQEQAREFLSQNSFGSIPAQEYFALPEPVRFFVFESLVQSSGFRKVTSRHFEEIESLLKKKRPVKKILGQVMVKCCYGHFAVVPVQTTDGLMQKRMEWQGILEGPGEYPIPPLGQILDVKKFSGFGESLLRTSTGQGGTKTLYLSCAKLCFPVTARFLSPGDRFQPFGMLGTKKISDFLIDRKVERSRRQEILSLSDEMGIACLIGYEIDHKYRVLNGSSTCWSVTLSNYEGESFLS